MPKDPQDRNELINSVALLVLDAQDCFIETLDDKKKFISRCAFAIDAARALGIRTLVTEQVPQKLGHTNERLLKRARSPRVFHKQSFSALNAPGIERYLRDNEIYHLIVCGLETPVCVYQTGLQAVDEDIDITFLVDALGCRREEDAPYALDALRALGCQVLPTESLFYSLLADVTHPSFKVYNSIVKRFSEPGFDIDAYLDTDPVPEPMAFDADRQSDEESEDNRSKRRRSRGSRRGRRREDPHSSESASTQKPGEKRTRPSKENANAPREQSNESPKKAESKPSSRKPGKSAPTKESPEPGAELESPKKRAAKKAARKAAKKATRKRPAKEPATPSD